MTHEQICQALQKLLSKVNQIDLVMGKLYMDLADLEASIYMEYVDDPNKPKKIKYKHKK